MSEVDVWVGEGAPQTSPACENLEATGASLASIWGKHDDLLGDPYPFHFHICSRGVLLDYGEGVPR